MSWAREGSAVFAAAVITAVVVACLFVVYRSGTNAV